MASMSDPRRVILFGAGEAGRSVLSELPLSDKVVAVADNSATKIGSFFCGHPIVSPDAIHAIEHDVIIVASMYWRDIVAQLKSMEHAEPRIEVAEISHRTTPVGPKEIHETIVHDAFNLIRFEDDFEEYRPLVSIILPTRNRSAVLSRAVESVLAQHYIHWELLIIDDGSTDDTRDHLEKLTRQDKRIRTFCRTQCGVSASRNTGLENAKGSLIAYLDSDNRWHSDYLQLMVQGFRYKEWSTGYAGINIFDQTNGRYQANIKGFNYEEVKRSNHIDLNVFMHRRELVDEYGPFNNSMTRLVDWDLILRYTKHHPPFIIPCVLADYFINAEHRRITDTEPFLTNQRHISKSLKIKAGRRKRLPGPMRVAYVQHEFPALSQTFLQNEIRFLMDQNIKVAVFYVRQSDVTGPVPDGLDMVKIRSIDHLVHLLGLRHIDLVHTHFAMPHVADLILPVCERLNLPFTQKPHAFDIFRRDHDPRHHISSSANHSLCKRVYCEGTYHQRFLASEGVKSEKLKIVRNIFDFGEFRVDKIKINEPIQRIVSISRFVEKKGYHLLIEAFMAIADPELCLSLYGYGEERSRLSEMAKSDKRIEINDGPRSVKEAVPLFRDADLFVLPCTMDRKGDTDGLPTVLMEAMAAGVPVLTTPIASIPDLVTDGKTGFLVESGSVESLLSGLHNTLQTTKDFREYIATSAMEHLDLHFAPISNTKAIVNDWRSLLNLRDEHVNLSILG